MMQIRLFGGVGAATTTGKPLDVGPAKCQAVLATLALSAGSAVPVSRLVETVWGSQPPRTADKTLQSYVTRLRKGLGTDSIVRVGAAYRLDVEADSVDVVRFQRRLDSGDIHGALAEWKGIPLAGLGAEGLTATVDGLIEQWLGALEVDLDQRIETDAQSTIGSLTELTANYPFREGLWALLMTALYRVGRQADALAAYRKAREHLIEHLGVEPGLRLRELESLVLGHDEQLTVDTSVKGMAANRAALGLPTGTVTFGFAEVEDSTRLWATHRHEMAAAMARHDELARAAAADHEGYIFSSAGDSFGVAFHRASDAVAWAHQSHAAVTVERWPGGLEVRLRVGLHTGETEERGKGYFGPAVIVATRIAAAGHGGQTLASAATSALLDRSDLRDLGTLHLGGAVPEQRLFQLDDGEHPPLRTEASERGRLPRRLGRLIGRDGDLRTVVDALAASPVVTLVGPGGIGKTRLALAAARVAEVDLADGAWLVELAGFASSSDVPRAVAEVLDVRERPGQTLTESIVAVLQSRQALLVLDNCEHVIDGAASFARAVAEGCPGVGVLATSREGLGLQDEQLIAVAPLEPVGPGVQLFNERALAVSRTFDPDASRNDVEEICRRLDGVPLAIELAAARTRSLSPADLVERLDDRLRLLTGGRRTSVERHRTLRATIQWSYDLLPPPEQVLFQRLSIFAGPFDLAAAGKVAADTALDVVDVDDLLGGLVERSMLIVESDSYGRRFRLLETMRQFGAEHLSDAGHTDLIAKRHAEWCLDQVTHIGELLAGPDEIEGVARLGELWPNLRAAFDWACATRDRHLARALVGPIAAEVLLRRQTGEIGEWAERILAMTPPDDEELIIFGLTWAARRYTFNHDREAYEALVLRYGEPDHPLVRHARASVCGEDEHLTDLAPESVAELRRQGEDHLADVFEIFVGGALLSTGRLEEHDELMTALVERHRVEGPPTLASWSLVMLGYSASFQGQHDRADKFFDDAARIDIPDRTHSVNKTTEARAAMRRGNRSQAFRILLSFIDELIDDDNMSGASLACIEFINMMTEVNRISDAAHVLGHLEITGVLDVEGPAFKTLVADAVATIAADSDPATHAERTLGRDLDDRQVLAYMSQVLSRLLVDGR